MKAIAIIKKPYANLCMGCPFCKGNDVRSCVCTQLGNRLLMEVDEYIDDDCPLKRIPKKEDIYERIYQAYGYGNDETYQRIRQTVEDIYDEILGETK